MPASGTMVSALVLTEAPVEAPPRPLLVSWLSARFCAAVAVCAPANELEFAAVAIAAVAAVVVPAIALLPVLLPAVLLLIVATVVLVPVALAEAVVVDAALLKEPTPAAVVCVPLSAPPVVLTHTSRSVSGFCQKLGSTSMTT
jgi:hypothetical protein